ncbi:MAG: efflux RND transporter permease subunit, partial [Elusimicrobia bacterium]|nr:efflux RND transporter permease subunit [Elusimicrobiota bacterium]
MKLIRLAVERPVTTAMVYAAIVLIGFIALFTLPRELFPTVSYPELLIVTRYGAAAPEEIENIVTKLIEEQAGTVPNLKSVQSISREGKSVVILKFNWGADMGLSHLAVREKIDLIKDRLPSEAEEPIVQRYNPFAQPMMILSLSGDLPLSDTTRLANEVVKKRLQKVDGVASAIVSGGQEREILVEVDIGKMTASNVSLSGIVDSLKTSNVNYPAGTTQGRFYEYLVRTIGEFQNVAEIGKTIVAVDTPRDSPEFMFKAQSQRRGAETFQPKVQRMMALNQIAEIKDTFKEVESYSRHNGSPNVSIAIQKQFDANTIKTARRVQRALSELTVSLPKELDIETVYDESVFIKGSLQDVMMDGVFGGLFAFLVLFFFLRKFQDAIVVTISLPISVLVFFVFLYFSGRSINMIALAGLSLAIGSITDNAIAVLENIASHRARGLDLKEAAIAGPSEIFVGQLSSMLTNIVVFFPLLFAQGLAQQLFKDLFYAAVITNIAALIVAVTLIPRIMAYPFSLRRQTPAEVPMEGEGTRSPETPQTRQMTEDDDMIGLGGKVVPQPPKNPGEETLHVDLGPQEPSSESSPKPPNVFKRLLFSIFQGLTPERSDKMQSLYQKILILSIQYRKIVLGGVLGLLLLSLLIFYFKEKIFMPSIDQGQFLVRVTMPVGTKLDVTNRVMTKIEDVLGKMDLVGDRLVRVGSSVEEAIESLGPNQADCMVTLDPNKKKGPTDNAILDFQERIKKVNLEGAEIECLLQDSSMKAMTGTGAPIAITIKGPDLGILRKMSDDLQIALKSIQGLTGIKTSLALPSFENRVEINKDRASAFGLSVSEISRSSMIGVRGFIATYYKEQGRETGVRVRLREEDRNNPSTISRVTIRSPQGVMVPLGDVATISSGYGPSEIQRMDQQRGVVVTAQVLGRSLGEVVEVVEKKLTA